MESCAEVECCGYAASPSSMKNSDVTYGLGGEADLRVMTGLKCIAYFAVLTGGACGEPSYAWAFAQNMDGSFHENELCRESLARSIYADVNREKTMREGPSNIFLFSGVMQRYRIYAFRSQNECETALTHMKLRQG